MSIQQFRDQLRALERVAQEDEALAEDILRVGGVALTHMRKAAHVRSQIITTSTPNSVKIPLLRNLLGVSTKRLDEVEQRYEELLRRLPGCAEPQP